MNDLRLSCFCRDYLGVTLLPSGLFQLEAWNVDKDKADLIKVVLYHDDWEDDAYFAGIVTQRPHLVTNSKWPGSRYAFVCVEIPLSSLSDVSPPTKHRRDIGYKTI